MFDISERKKTEEKLIALQKKLEEYSFKDGLTGLSNRRMFDTVIEDTWLSAQRNRQPLSLILLDIDHFKQYNDLYGHIQGDECLRRVSSVLAKAIKRPPKDFVGRFGGEEFVIVLPESDADAAVRVAERCISELLREQIPPHADNSASSW